jgi:hypothetical protein
MQYELGGCDLPRRGHLRLGNLSEHRATILQSSGMGGVPREVLLCVPAIARWLSGFIGRRCGVPCSSDDSGASDASAAQRIVPIRPVVRYLRSINYWNDVFATRPPPQAAPTGHSQQAALPACSAPDCECEPMRQII